MSWLSDLQANPAIDELAQATAGQGAVAPIRHSPAPPPEAQPQAQPAGPGGGGGASGNLVDYGGYKIDESIYGQANEISTRFPGLQVSSGHRSPERNAAVGGVKHSDHLTGRAVDYTGSPKDMYGAVAYANANGAKQAIVHNVGSGVHAHIAW